MDAKHLFELALSVVNPERSVAEAARKHGSTAAEIEEWPERSFAAVENALRARPTYEEVIEDEKIRKLGQKVGGRRLDLDILRAEARGGPPYRSDDARRIKQTMPRIGSVAC